MKNLFKSLADFQQEVPVIHKGTKGYGYTYADLPAIFEVINPLLKKHGLGFSQLIEGQSIKTIVFHIESGETLESSTDIPQGVNLAKMNEFQVLGSAITYIRRYAISSVLGLVTDKDTDAGGDQQPKQAPKQNINPVPSEIIKDVTDQLSQIDSTEDLAELFKQYKDKVSKYPSIKGMFTNKKVALNGNA